MRTLLYLVEKEFKQIMRDRFLPKIIFLVPIMQLLILPFAADFELRNINLALIDHDQSTASMRLRAKVVSSGYFRLTNLASGYEEGLGAIERNEADILLEIPAGFGKAVDRHEEPGLHISANAINGAKGGLGSAYLTAILQDFKREEAGLSLPSGKIYAMYLFNPHINYKSYMVPGIIVLLLTIIAGFLSALNIVREKERGTIEQINVTPVPKALFLLSKLIPFWIIGFLLLSLSLAIAYVVYGLTPVGTYALIYLFAALYLVAFTGFGLAISAISSNQQQAMFTAFFFLIIFALMSGLFTPINSMPAWAQQITFFNPVRYFVEVMRMVYLKGSTLSDLSTHFLIISLFAIALNTLAIIAYRKNN
jgi:ABC-2 type transport system permease protein